MSRLRRLHDDWESRVVQQLYAEFAASLRGRKLELKTPRIELFESDRRWGEWDGVTRTIRISRRLVREYPWFRVIAVLRHEMAHQLVDQEARMAERRGIAAQATRPHGEGFVAACRSLGVPEDFCRASADLQAEETTDWRNPAETPDPAERLLAKVRKLLALATSSNEHEALLAMNKVRELYAKYHLEEAEALAASGAPLRFSRRMITLGKKRVDGHISRVLSILVEHFFVQVITHRLYDAASGEHHRAFELIGTRENVLMAEYVYSFLLQQVEALLEGQVRLQEVPLGRLTRKSFRLGVLRGFSDKLELAEMAQVGAASAPHSLKEKGSRGSGEGSSAVESAKSLTPIGRALAVFRDDPRLNDYLAQVYPRLRSRRAASQFVDTEAYSAGAYEGERLTLHRAVETKARPSIEGHPRLLGSPD